jgi:dsDNA-binding SOS-regulon protein
MKSGDAQAALDAAERGLSIIKSVPTLEAKQVEEYRVRLQEVLASQKDIIERFMKMQRKDWRQVENEETKLIDRAKEYHLIKSGDQTDEPKSP